MTKWLASIQSIQEAQKISSVLPDILDMKNPAQGALGAMKHAEVVEVVKLINGQCLTSATIGDLPMQAELIADAIEQMAATGVDYVKIGIFPDKNIETCLDKLAETIEKLSTPVIAVIFADNMVDTDLIPLLKQAGFQGVMVDTAIKDGQTLLDHWSPEQLTSFVQLAKQLGLLCGLAGALRQQDIAQLSCFNADYLGFRSALCTKRDRTTEISLDAVKQVQQVLYASSDLVA
jgi:uncharacterized protein (UPF0264 family)